MPDLTIVVMQQCSSWSEHNDQLNGYVQTGVRTPWAHCTCPAFKFSKSPKICKHIKRAESHGCLYHEQFDGPPEVKGICPKCGKKTEFVRVGV